MTWVRIDDEWPTHPKARAAGLHGRALQVAGLCFCNRHETDGFIDAPSVRLLLATAEVDEDTPQRLVEVGMWEVVPGGYLIHDYLVYNPSRADLEAKRDAGKERARMSKERRTQEASREADVKQQRSFASASRPLQVTRPVPTRVTTTADVSSYPHPPGFVRSSDPAPDFDAQAARAREAKEQLRKEGGAA